MTATTPTSSHELRLVTELVGYVRKYDNVMNSVLVVGGNITYFPMGYQVCISR